MPVREDQKIQVQQATDIVRLIGEHVALRPKGREFAGLCPFHDDQNPSMFVSPAKQIYKCFSCGAGGDVFTFVTQYHKMTFPEALRHLADQAGIKLQAAGGRGQGSDEGPSERQRIAAANELAMGFFRTLYKHPEHGQAVREYVEKRGINAEMIEAFQLGYASDRWDGLATTIDRKSWDLQSFIAAGLVTPRNRNHDDSNNSELETRNSKPSNCYDRLRHRLIFPIFDAIGRPIAFGGRKLREADEPKYLNSPETKLFNKSATLYGLHLAKKPIIDSKTAVIVEGYTDVIACHQHGAKNVVATLGTALTREHVGELRRYAQKVVLVFDADEAGRKAADRAVELFLTGDLDVAIAVLPTGPDGAKLDPAELLAQPDGLAQWRRVVDDASDALAYQFDRIAADLTAAGTITGRQAIAEAYLDQLGRLGLSRMGQIRRALTVQRLANLLKMSESAVNDVLTGLEQRNTRFSQPAQPAQPDADESPWPAESLETGDFEADKAQPDVASRHSRSTLKAVERAERQLVGCLLRDTALFHHTLSDGRTLDEALTPAEMVTSIGRRVYQWVYNALCETEPVTLASLLGTLAEETDTQPLANWLTDADAEVEKATAGKAELLMSMLTSAAEALLAFEGEKRYRADLRGRAVAGEDRSLREAMASLRANPSPVRIARPRS
ncbi:DNA primase [Phycisphaerales bacterium AB-hyl4]|uniref:DNA primase n=1 Tax=Natronomicrosphaera hydrolytica TaxID=3242702 RepID=A0ABV4U5I8_9BACT